MKFKLISIGNQMPAWVSQAYNDYAKRFAPPFQLQLIEIPNQKRTKQADLQRLAEQEAQKMLEAIKPNDRVIALDVKGQGWSTEQLAQKINGWRVDARPTALLVGGPEGLHPSCLDVAELRWSLSALTFPHMMVRVIVAEQIYRGVSIVSGHPYHRS